MPFHSTYVHDCICKIISLKYQCPRAWSCLRLKSKLVQSLNPKNGKCKKILMFAWSILVPTHHLILWSLLWMGCLLLLGWCLHIYLPFLSAAAVTWWWVGPHLICPSLLDPLRSWLTAESRSLFRLAVSHGPWLTGSPLDVPPEKKIIWNHWKLGDQESCKKSDKSWKRTHFNKNIKMFIELTKWTTLYG